MMPAPSRTSSFDIAETALPSDASCSEDESEHYTSPSAINVQEETELVATPSPWLFSATLHPSFMSVGPQSAPYIQDPLSMLVASAAAAANAKPTAPPPQYVPSVPVLPETSPAAAHVPSVPVLPETSPAAANEIAQSLVAPTMHIRSALSHAWQQPSLTAAHPINLAEHIQCVANREELAQGEVDAFVVRWGLNQKSTAIIAGLPPAVRRDVVQNFKANALTRDVNSKFMSWLSSKMRQRDELQCCLSTTMEERQEFYQRWKLDTKCRQLVEEQPPHVQRELISNFNPPPGTTNVAGRMTSFLNMILNKPGQRSGQSGSSADVEQFVVHWGLDGDARSSLVRLPRELQVAVMQGFNPGYQLSDVSRKFTAFVKSVQPKSRHGRAKPGATGHVRHGAWHR